MTGVDQRERARREREIQKLEQEIIRTKMRELIYGTLCLLSAVALVTNCANSVQRVLDEEREKEERAKTGTLSNTQVNMNSSAISNIRDMTNGIVKTGGVIPFLIQTEIKGERGIDAF